MWINRILDRARWSMAMLVVGLGCVPPAAAANAAPLAAPISAHPRTVLDDKALDLVIAGAARADLDLSAAADGPTAVVSTQGSITAARGTVLRIAIDPEAPGPAQAKLLSQSVADFVLANGKAEASGTDNAQCSASLAVIGDVTYVTQSRMTTPTSATCLCSGFAIGFVGQ